jgi:membrane-bound serine protease (ClpP class)
MAPGTHIGAAHPVAGNGEKVDDTMAKKMASDVAAYARTLATQRKRNVELVEQAVLESRSFTEQEAIKSAPPLIDLIANDVRDLVRKLDGRSVTRFDGRTETLHTAGATTVFIGMTRSQQVLSAIAHPQIAYLLLTLGTLGLTIELWSPGAVLPGVVGGICLLLAFFAFQVLPVSYAGVLLILFGLALLILEVKVTSFGLLAVGGITSLVLGSMMLIDSPLPEMQVGLRLIVPITLGIAGVLLFLVRLAVRAQRALPTTGVAGMLNELGYALTPIEAGSTGRVRTHGEIWTATADERIEVGGRVRITGMNGLRLHVTPSDPPVASPAASALSRTSAAAPDARGASPGADVTSG